MGVSGVFLNVEG